MKLNVSGVRVCRRVAPLSVMFCGCPLFYGIDLMWFTLCLCGIDRIHPLSVCVSCIVVCVAVVTSCAS